MSEYVFISYSHEDEDFVLKLVTNLKTKGVPVWLDKWDIPLGDNWLRTIEGALTNCASMLLILSPAAVASNEVQSEWLKVRKDKKKVIPVLYKKCDKPYQLDPIQHLDFTSGNPDDDVALSSVLLALGMTESVPPKTTESPQEEIIPESSSKGKAIEVQADSSKLEVLGATGQMTSTSSTSTRIYFKGAIYSTLQAVIDVAKPRETINVPEGTYAENILIDKSLTIIGSGAGKTIIDGSQVDSVIKVGSRLANIDVTLSGLSIQGGTGTSVLVYEHNAARHICGGGVLNYGRLVIRDSIISNNKAEHYGGGIFNKGIVILNSGTTVTLNTAHDGGGIYGSKGLINLDGGSVIDNKAEQCGAGIYVGYRCSAKIQTGTISDNISGNMGGGIHNQGGFVEMNGGTIFGNDAHASGGGIYSSSPTAMNLKGGSIHGNTARLGAGVCNGGSTMILDGALIYNNIANENEDGLGGGIYNSGTLTLISGSINNNQAFREGGGIYNGDHAKLLGDKQLAHENALINGLQNDIAPEIFALESSDVE